MSSLKSWLRLGLIVVIVTILGVVAWQAFNRGIGNPAYNLPAKPALDNSHKAACEQTKKDSKICAFLSTGEANIPYEAKMAVKAKGSSTTTTIKSDTKNLAINIQDQSGKELLAAVEAGKDTYVKDQVTGKWKKEVQSQPMENPFTAGKKLINDQKNSYKFLGIEPCGNVRCYKYQVINPETSGAQLYFQFDIKNYVLRQIQSTNQGTAMDLRVEYKPVTVAIPATSP